MQEIKGGSLRSLWLVLGSALLPFAFVLSSPLTASRHFSSGTAEGMAPGPTTGRCKDSRVPTVWLGLGSQEHSEGF